MVDGEGGEEKEEGNTLISTLCYLVESGWGGCLKMERVEVE